MAREKGKGGLRHRAIQRLLAEYFRKQGKIAVIEAFIGKNVDILVNDSDKSIAVEIQLTPKNCLQIKKDYELGCDEVWIISDSAKVLGNIKRKVQNKIDATLFSKTKFHLTKDFLPHKIIKISE